MRSSRKSNTADAAKSQDGSVSSASFANASATEGDPALSPRFARYRASLQNSASGRSMQADFSESSAPSAVNLSSSSESSHFSDLVANAEGALAQADDSSSSSSSEEGPMPSPGFVSPSEKSASARITPAETTDQSGSSRDMDASQDSGYLRYRSSLADSVRSFSAVPAAVDASESSTPAALLMSDSESETESSDIVAQANAALAGLESSSSGSKSPDAVERKPALRPRPTGAAMAVVPNLDDSENTRHSDDSDSDELVAQAQLALAGWDADPSSSDGSGSDQGERATTAADAVGTAQHHQNNDGESTDSSDSAYGPYPTNTSMAESNSFDSFGPKPDFDSGEIEYTPDWNEADSSDNSEEGPRQMPLNAAAIIGFAVDGEEEKTEYALDKNDQDSSDESTDSASKRNWLGIAAGVAVVGTAAGLTGAAIANNSDDKGGGGSGMPAQPYSAASTGNAPAAAAASGQAASAQPLQMSSPDATFDDTSDASSYDLAQFMPAAGVAGLAAVDADDSYEPASEDEIVYQEESDDHMGDSDDTDMYIDKDSQALAAQAGILAAVAARESFQAGDEDKLALENLEDGEVRDSGTSYVNPAAMALAHSLSQEMEDESDLYQSQKDKIEEAESTEIAQLASDGEISYVPDLEDGLQEETPKPDKDPTPPPPKPPMCNQLRSNCSYKRLTYCLVAVAVIVGTLLSVFGSDWFGNDSSPRETTAMPTIAPTARPTTAVPTFAPTSSSPTLRPTTRSPTQEPTSAPILEPTFSPTLLPTATPSTPGPTEPTSSPTLRPTPVPTVIPSLMPSASPSSSPGPTASRTPTASPSTSRVPTASPSRTPTASPSASRVPTASPSLIPTAAPSASRVPTVGPSLIPTTTPSASSVPTASPTQTIFPSASRVPTASPTQTQTVVPTTAPVSTASPTQTQTVVPTTAPTVTVVPEALLAIISAASFDGGEAVRTEGTPQNDAAKWLTNDSAFDGGVGNLTPLQAVQRYVLATFYFSTRGDTWDMNEGWLSAEDECDWFTRSIRNDICDSDGVFTGLELAFNNLRGSLPPELGLLTSLTRISLGAGFEGNIRGPIPTELGLLTNMMNFNLRDNAIVGFIPSELGEWTSLEVLDLSRNRVSGTIPTTIGEMSSLRRLNLASNRLTGRVPNEMAALTLLEVVRLDHNDLTGVVPLSVCATFIDTEPLFSTDCGVPPGVDSEIGCFCCTQCCSESQGCVTVE